MVLRITISFFVAICAFLLLTNSALALDPEKSHFGLSSAQPQFIQIFSDAGLKWARVARVAWGFLEPFPPKNGKHSYNWEKMDKRIRKMQDAGIRVQVILRSASTWGTKVNAKWQIGKDFKSALPEDKYREDYKAFVFNIVERYDGDGNNDMPGLKIPIKYWQIESEAQHKHLWVGTIDEYKDLLAMAYTSIKKANPSAQVILAEFNFSSLFDNIKNEDELQHTLSKVEGSPRYKAKLDFIKSSLKAKDNFDIIGFHANTNYTGISWTVKWLRKEMKKLGYEKPIWIGDALSGPLLERSPFKTEEECRKGKEILDILENKSNPQHREIEKWYRREQAKLTFKKMVSAVESGVERIFINNPIDWTKYHIRSYRFAGLLDRNRKPRPAFYTYTLVLNKLDGFKKVERLNTDRDIYAYAFGFKNKMLYVCWAEGKRKHLSLDLNGKKATIIEVLPDSDGVFKTEEREIKDGVLSINLTDIPKIIEIQH